MIKMITKFKSIRKKSKILNAGYGLMQYYPLLSPDSHSGAQAKETNFVNHFYTNHNAPCLPPPPRPAQIIFNFTWDDCNTQ